MSHFEQLAAQYDVLRSGAGELIEAIAAENDPRGRLLDVGCGTGRLLDALSSGFDVEPFGIDPSAAMLDQARAKLSAATLMEAPAESIPFPDAFFDRAVMLFVVHHLDRPRAFRELRRLLRPGGRLTIANADPEAVHAFWMAPLFPSYVSIEQARCPSADVLHTELSEAGFGRTTTRTFDEHRVFSRAQALEKLRGRAYSTFEHMDDGEYHAGVELAERNLPKRVEYTLRLLLVSADVSI